MAYHRLSTYFKSIFLALCVSALSLSFVIAQEPQPEPQGDGTEQTDAGADTGKQFDEAVLAKGKTLWENNCVSCHGLKDEVVIGPGLYQVWERTPGREWMVSWIKNSQKMVQSGDEYAVQVFNQYNQNVMTSFPWPDEDINAVLDYIEYQSPKEMTKPDEVLVDTKTGALTAEADSGLTNYFNLLLGVLVFTLVLILVVLGIMINVLKRYLNQQEGLSEDDKEVIDPKSSWSSVFQSQAFIGGVTTIFVLVALKATLDGLLGVGVQQGYAPRQPIAFSHKLHAGMYNVDCNYCHTGVYEGKSAVIPSANICMNCHNAIKQTSPEIQKIYRAIEQDKPIEWVRVHNLPDLAYFNHAQHTNVAGLACENCHGEIKEMEVVQQRAPLTMGWCINCHRQTVVDHAKDNPYYDRLMEYHNTYNGKDPMTVENIGGLECSKCHY